MTDRSPERPAPFPEADPAWGPSSAGPDRRRLLAYGALVAIVLAVAGWFLLGGSGSQPATTATSVAPPRLAVSPSPSPTTVAVPLAAAPAVRDPFHVLVAQPASGSAPAGGTSPSPAAPSLSPSAPPTYTPPAYTPPAAPPAPSPAPSPTASPTPTTYPVTLVAISAPSPQVRTTTWSLSGQKVTVLPGQRFGRTGELVVLAYRQDAQGAVNTAILQVGSDNPIDVAVNQTVSVR